MQFGWINLIGAAIVIIMLIPNIIFAVRYKDMENKCHNRFMNILEQVGRYTCFILMWMPLFVWKFGFASIAELFIYVLGNGALLMAYLIVWVFYFKKPTLAIAMSLAIIPTVIFFLSGVLLRHWFLVAGAVLFGIGHLYVTYENH